jgi:2-phosphoglycerate kinase
MFSERLMPTLHTSSFEAASAIRGPVPRSADPVIVGYEQQVRAVSVAVEALIERSVLEGTDLIIEGAHLVPGFISSPPWGPPWEDKAVVVHIVVTVDDEDVHRSHFFLRASEAGQRNVERYLTAFDNIRKVQKYIRSAAQQHGAPVIPSYSLDATLTAVIDHVVEQAVQRTGVRGT